jgi:hypothetical protein
MRPVGFKPADKAYQLPLIETRGTLLHEALPVMRWFPAL